MIFKFQQGGSAIPPLVSYEPAMVTDSGTSEIDTTRESPKESSDLTDKDLLKMLKDLDGLPNDMQVLTETLQNFYIDQQYSPFPNTVNIASRYLQALFLMRTANFNRKQYDNAFNIVSNNGGINELAINERGQLVCVNSKGDFKFLLPEQLKDNPEYTPVYNAELLKMRAYSPELANNNEVLSIVSNGIGMKSILELVSQVITDLGSTEKVDEGFTSTPSKELLNGLKAFQKASLEASKNGQNFDGTVDNLYKGKLLTQSQAEQAEAALRFIYRSLTPNAQTLLKVKASQPTEEGAVQMLGELIQSKITNRTEFTMTVDTPTSKTTDGSPKSGTFDAIKLDPVKTSCSNFIL